MQKFFLPRVIWIYLSILGRNLWIAGAFSATLNIPACALLFLIRDPEPLTIAETAKQKHGLFFGFAFVCYAFQVRKTICLFNS